MSIIQDLDSPLLFINSIKKPLSESIHGHFNSNVIEEANEEIYDYNDYPCFN